MRGTAAVGQTTCGALAAVVVAAVEGTAAMAVVVVALNTPIWTLTEVAMLVHCRACRAVAIAAEAAMVPSIVTMIAPEVAAIPAVEHAEV